MQKHPFLTVYVLNYNYGRFIKEAVQSVLKQEYKSFEFMVIDDGSNDESSEILYKLRAKNKFKLIEQENEGMMKSLNIALNHAKGSYIIRLDADDLLRKDALQHFAEYIQNEQYAYVFPAYKIINEEGRITKTMRINKNSPITKHVPHGACTAVSIKRLKAINGYSEMYKLDDGAFLWKMFHEEKIGYIDIPLFYYRRHGTNLSLQIREMKKERKLIFMHM